MTADISKIRDERLTEDEKMELIADYLENGGGSSSKLRIKVNIDYVPTMAAEIQYAEGEGTGVYTVVDSQYISIQDEKGNPVSVDTLKENIINGTVEIIGMDHLGDQAIIDGDSVTLVSGGAQFSSVPTGTMFADDVMYMAIGQIRGVASTGVLTAGLTVTGDNMVAMVGVVIQ